MEVAAIPPDPDEMNENRALAAERSLLFFAQDFGETDERGAIADLAKQNLSDLLADFAHYCDREGLALLQCLSNSRSNYCEETSDQGKQFFGLKITWQGKSSSETKCV